MRPRVDAVQALRVYGLGAMRRLLALSVIGFALVACGDDDAASTSDAEDPTTTATAGDRNEPEVTSVNEPQPCPVEPGDIIPANYHEVGCVDTERNDQVSMGSFFNCRGGERLFSDDVGHGYLGEPLEAPDDDALAAAMEECDP